MRELYWNNSWKNWKKARKKSMKISSIWVIIDFQIVYRRKMFILVETRDVWNPFQKNPTPPMEGNFWHRACRNIFSKKPTKFWTPLMQTSKVPTKKGWWNLSFHIGGVRFFWECPDAVASPYCVPRVLLICIEVGSIIPINQVNSLSIKIHNISIK